MEAAKEFDVVMPEAAKKKHLIHEVFRRFDTDGSDGLSREELLQVMYQLGVPVNEEKDSEELFDELDADSSGVIDFDEFDDCKKCTE